MTHDLNENTAPVDCTAALKAFCERLEWFRHIDGTEPGATNAAKELFQIGDALLKLKEAMPYESWQDVRHAIGDEAKADDWEKQGHTYASAAGLVRASMLQGFFMASKVSYPVYDETFEITPGELLRSGGEDFGVDDLSERWIAAITESDEPDAGFEALLNSLAGVLANVEMAYAHYKTFIEKAT